MNNQPRPSNKYPPIINLSTTTIFPSGVELNAFTLQHFQNTDSSSTGRIQFKRRILDSNISKAFNFCHKSRWNRPKKARWVRVSEKEENSEEKWDERGNCIPLRQDRGGEENRGFMGAIQCSREKFKVSRVIAMLVST